MREALLTVPIIESVGEEPTRPPTAAEALERLAFTWERLEKLARRALHDHMRKRRINLDAQRYEEALDFYVEVGARWAISYDPDLANGVSFSTSCYRRMYPRLTDYLRARHGDERHGRPITEQATDKMPEDDGTDEPTFKYAAAAVADGLPARARRTLELLGRPMAEEGLTVMEAAARAGIAVAVAEELLEELGWRLGHRPRAVVDDAPSEFNFLVRFVI